MSDNTANYHRCPYCNQLVPNDQSHTCAMFPVIGSAHAIWPTPINDNNPLERIANALERIAAALEKNGAIGGGG